MKKLETVLCDAGVRKQREVFSRRTFKGQPIGAMIDKGALWSVWQWGDGWILNRKIRDL